ncbi:lysine--tRNA ligase [candidate division WOR-3 bacterium]|nr:lysine--tRNA ligase [candidate division WOR-3 bacterium]
MSSEYDIRVEKREELIRSGHDPYPYSFNKNREVKEVLENFEDLAEEIISLAGRIVSMRGHGKSVFSHLSDSSGSMQLYFQLDSLGEESFDLVKKIDIGDFVGVEGTLMTTKTGEKTLRVKTWRFLAKALMNLPEKYHGLKDPETRYRQRYLDFISNPESRRKIEARSRIVRTVRRKLDSLGFLEVETPVLQPVYGGAFAEPFVTKYNSLGADFYLRVSNELYLKRLLIGGFEKVYEFAKDFRNEGMDKDHNPEFTQVEAYWAYVDYHEMMKLTEDIFRETCVELHGEPFLKIRGEELDFSKPWKRVDYFGSLEDAAGIKLRNLPKEDLIQICTEKGIDTDRKNHRGKIIDALFSGLVQPYLIQPSFVMDHPLEISPLAKTHRKDPSLVERFEPIVLGMELGNSFSELNDPIEQRKRLEYQNELRKSGEKEYEPIDEDFLLAMSYGMPPAGGLGLGIDRMAMLFTASDSIREVITFPQLKPLQTEQGE